MASGTLGKPKLTAYSLLIPTTITATDTTYSTYNGRKFSDYPMLVFGMGVSQLDRRATQTMASSEWVSGCVLNITSVHGSNLENRSSVTVTYVSDTQLKVKTGGSKAFTSFWCTGFRAE